MENPGEKQGGETRSDLELAERLLVEAEALVAQTRQTEEGLVREAADMAEGNQRLNQAVRTNPSYMSARWKSEMEVKQANQEIDVQEKADIEAGQQIIDDFKLRLAALEANQVDNAVLEQIRGALAVAEANLQQKIEQANLAAITRKDEFRSLSDKHTGFANEQAKTAEDGGVDFAVETVAAAHKIDNPGAEVDQEKLKDKTKEELKKRENESKISAALEKYEAQLVEYEELVASVEQEFLDLQKEYETKLGKVRSEIQSTSFLAEVKAMIDDYHKKADAKVFKDRARRQRDMIRPQLDEKHYALTGTIDKGKRKVVEFCYRHSDRQRYNNISGSIYRMDEHMASSIHPKPGDISDDLMERLQNFQQKFEGIKVRRDDLAGKIKEYWRSAEDDGRDLDDQVSLIFSLKK